VNPADPREPGRPEDAPGLRIEITSDLDRRAVEALRLEIRRLSRVHGVRITDVRIERAPADASGPSA
jgi:hypothetical protein